ncbi:MAG TPA: DUF4372 domain-containing protein, partial [Thiomicrorhabdus sp.]|nr:DUF4372 domain-containing protein [Thiomicrorhabdus sp.]
RWSQFVTMSMAQLAGRNSLRLIRSIIWKAVELLRGCHYWLYC